MGTDLFGWLEIRERPGAMRGIVQLTSIITRDSFFFGCVFGVHPSDGLVPLTQPRALPADISDEARRELLEEDGSTTFHETAWLTGEEFLARRPQPDMEWPRERIELSFRETDGRFTVRSENHSSSSLLRKEDWARLRGGEIVDRNRWRYRLINDVARINPTENWLLLDALVGRLSDRRDPRTVRIVAAFA